MRWISLLFWSLTVFAAEPPNDYFFLLPETAFEVGLVTREHHQSALRSAQLNAVEAMYYRNIAPSFRAPVNLANPMSHDDKVKFWIEQGNKAKDAIARDYANRTIDPLSAKNLIGLLDPQKGLPAFSADTLTASFANKRLASGQYSFAEIQKNPSIQNERIAALLADARKTPGADRVLTALLGVPQFSLENTPRVNRENFLKMHEAAAIGDAEVPLRLVRRQGQRSDTGQKASKAQLDKELRELLGAFSAQIDRQQKEWSQKRQDLQDEERQKKVDRSVRDSYRQAFQSLTAAYGLLGGADAQKTAVVLQGIYQTGENLIDTMRVAKELLKGGQNFAGALLVTTGFIGAGIAIVSLISSLSSESIEETLLQEMHALREQIERLHREMVTRFFYLDERLATMHEAVLAEFRQLREQNYAHTDKLQSLLLHARNLQRQQTTSQYADQERARALWERTKNIDHDIFTPGYQLEAGVYRSSLQEIQKQATLHVFDVISTSKNGPLPTLRPGIGYVSDRGELRNSPAPGQLPLQHNLHFATFLSGAEALRAIDGDVKSSAGNVFEWASYVEDYVFATTRRPKEYRAYATAKGVTDNAEVQKIRDAGQRIFSAFRRVNGDVVTRLLRSYREALAELDTAYAAERKRFIAASVKELGTKARLPHDSLRGIDPWVDIDAQNQKTLRENLQFPKSMTMCPGATIAIEQGKADVTPTPLPLTAIDEKGNSFPQHFLEKHTPFVVAANLGLGSFSFCYRDVQWTAEETWTPYDFEKRVVYHVARLSFVVEGSFHIGGKVVPVFQRKFVDVKDNALHWKTAGMGTYDDATLTNTMFVYKHRLSITRLPPTRYLSTPVIHPHFELLRQTLEARWKGSLGPDFVALSTDTSDAKLVAQSRAAVVAQLQAHFAASRQVIYDAMLLETKIGGGGAKEPLRAPNDRLDLAVATLEGLLGYRLPDSRTKATGIAAAFSGYFALPVRSGAFEAVGSEEAISLDVAAQEKNAALTTLQQGFLPTAFGKAAVQHVVHDASVELAKTRVVRAYIDEALPALETPGLADAGINADDVKSVRDAVAKKTVQRRHLTLLALAWLYKDAVATRLALPNYGEAHPALIEGGYLLDVLDASLPQLLGRPEQAPMPRAVR